MKSVQRRVIREQENDPFHGDYVHLEHAIEGQHYSREQLSRYFGKYVDKNDYAKSEKKGLVDHLWALQELNLTKNRGESASGEGKKCPKDNSSSEHKNNKGERL